MISPYTGVMVSRRQKATSSAAISGILLTSIPSSRHMNQFAQPQPQFPRKGHGFLVLALVRPSCIAHPQHASSVSLLPRYPRF